MHAAIENVIIRPIILISHGFDLKIAAHHYWILLNQLLCWVWVTVCTVIFAIKETKLIGSWTYAFVVKEMCWLYKYGIMVFVLKYVSVS